MSFMWEPHICKLNKKQDVVWTFLRVWNNYFEKKTQQTSFIFAHEEQVESLELFEAESAIVESDTAFWQLITSCDFKHHEFPLHNLLPFWLHGRKLGRERLSPHQSFTVCAKMKELERIWGFEDYQDKIIEIRLYF